MNLARLLNLSKRGNALTTPPTCRLEQRTAVWSTTKQQLDVFHAAGGDSDSLASTVLTNYTMPQTMAPNDDKLHHAADYGPRRPSLSTVLGY